MTTAHAAQITIRPAYADDELAVVRLAALDSADAPPPTPLLVAEVDGQLRVALSLRDGSAIADPFVPTADILALVRAYASAPGARGARRLLGRRGRNSRRLRTGALELSLRSRAVPARRG
jgi:hypothetical protein